jgi:hypothetical protein
MFYGSKHWRMKTGGRRRYLQAFLGTVPFLSGCVDFTRYEGYVDLELHNASDNAYRVTITLRDDGDNVFEETYDMDPSEKVLEEEVVEQGEYHVLSDIENGRNRVSESAKLVCDSGEKSELVVQLDESYSSLIQEQCR